MKNLAKIFMAVAAGIFAFSCVTDATEDLGVKIEGQKGGIYEVTLSLEQSRTQLGEKVEGLYPLYWSEGDAIAINGVVSAPLAGVAANSDAATFNFAQPVAAPYCVVYPAAAAVAVDDEVVEEPVAPVTVYPVTFAATQPYTVGTFASGVAPMYGYAETVAEGEEQPAIALQHLTGVLRLAIKGNGEKVTSIKVVSEKGAIAGPHTVDCANGALTALEGASNVVNVTFAEGLVLGAEATPIYVAVPAGDYGTFLITVATEAHQKMTLKFNSSIKPINAGAVREFSEFAYEANLADSEDAEVLIDSYESLIAFAKIAPSFYPRTSAKITANIDMTGKAWTPIEYFGEYEFDGGNFEIKGLSAPLFNKTAAHIKNLKLTDLAMVNTDYPIFGAIACHLYGSLEGCSAEGTININNTTATSEDFGENYDDNTHATLVGMAHAATVKDCVSNVDITITSLCNPDLQIKSSVGGLVGCASYGSKFHNLTNNGNILYAATTQQGNLYIAGIVGKDDTSHTDVPGIAEMSNCTNNGNISSTADCYAGMSLDMAGITGRLAPGAEVLCENLVNNGAITFKGEAVSEFRGAGLSCYSCSASLKDCTNNGAITLATGAKTKLTYIAGLISGSNTAALVTNCHNKAALTVGDNITFVGFCNVVGLIDSPNAFDENSTITNCTNSGAIKIGKVSNVTTSSSGNDERMYIGGLFRSFNSGNASNCYNEATGTITIDAAKWVSRFMVGGFTSYQSYHSTKPATLTDCENRANISIKAEEVGSATIGGITSEHYAPNTVAPVVSYTRVINKGNISIDGKITTNNFPLVGGIIGLDNGPTFVADACTNYGNITFESTYVATTPVVGGIMGKDTNKGTLTIKNCVNHGNLVNNCVLGSAIRMGGILAWRAVALPTTIENCTNLGAVNCAVDQTVNKGAFCYTIAGIVGYTPNAGMVIKGCVNGSESDATKGAISLGKGQSGVCLSGIMGLADGPVTISECKNYGVVKQTGLGGYDKSYRAFIGGILSYCSVAGSSVTNCYNYGDVSYGTVGGGARVDVGGIVGATKSGESLIQYCYNAGTVSFNAKGCSTEMTVAGIIGCPQGTTKVYDCANLASGKVVWAGASSSNVDVGGIAGGPSGAYSEFVRCKNLGTVEQTVASTGSTYFGGIIGYGYSLYKIIDCENWGAIKLNNKGTASNKALYVGGIVGWARIPSSNGTVADLKEIKNCANYADIDFTATAGTLYGGGVAGYVNNEDAEMMWGEISGLKNIANLTFSSNISTKHIGGIFGLIGTKTNPEAGALANIKNCVFYGNIKALGLSADQIGVIAGGVSRTADKFVVKDSQIGGNFVFGTATEEDANGDNVTYDVETPIDLTAIYKNAITEAQAKEDGCSLLTSKPAVPTKPTK